MAFGFGIGDLVLLTKTIVTTIGNIYNAPAELQEVAERVELVEMDLQSLNSLPSTAVTGHTEIIKARVKRIRKTLSDMRDIVIRYGNTDGWRNVLSRTGYGIWDKGGVGDLLKDLEQRTDDLTHTLVIQILVTTNQIRPQIDKILMSIRQDPTRNDGASLGSTSSTSPQDSTVLSKQGDLVQSGLKQVLDSMQTYDSTAKSSREDTSIQREIEKRLFQVGIDGTVTKAVIDTIETQGRLLAHPEDIDPISYIGGKTRLETPKGWIMVVDSFNEVRSIIAQTYLELVRAWTVNVTGEWLFNRVESAGVDVSTKFAERACKSRSISLVKGGLPPEKAALKAISGKESHFQSEEKNDILARVAQHRSRGIDNWHFRKYEYMLCFSKSVYERLKMFAKHCQKRYGNLPDYAIMSKIILVKDVQLKCAARDLDAARTTELVESIKKGIKEFLRKEYGWERPPLPIADGQFRTKQMVVRSEDIRFSLDERESKLNQVASKSNCRIRVTDEKFDSQLFSITGKKRDLPLAYSLLQETLLGSQM